MNRLLVAAVVLAGAASANGQIVQWNFNTAITPPGTTVPNIGTGTASLVGGTTATFATGNPLDVVTAPTVNSGWNVTTWAAQGTGSGTRGVQFATSTAGFENIQVSWQHRHSNTSSRFVQFQYSTDGLSFTSAGLAGDGIFTATAGDTWFARSVDLSGIAGVADNASFAFRVVAIVDAASGNYLTSNPTSTYGTAGTNRFDLVTVTGTVVPAPSAAAAMVLVGLAASRRRRA